MKRLALCIALLAGACSDPVQPVQPQSESFDEVLAKALSEPVPLFVEFNADAFTAAQREASFWAVKGRDTHVALRYSDTGEEFLRFEVSERALAYHPDGTAFARGDSVLITVRTDETGQFAFHFSPSGLTFDAASPARLTVNRARTNTSAFSVYPWIWKRETPLDPWVSVPTSHFGNVARAAVYDFTSFGMAVN